MARSDRSPSDHNCPAQDTHDGDGATSTAIAQGRLLTITEVAELTGLSVGTLYHFVSAKRIPVIRFSSRCLRFRPSDLEAWFETKRQAVKIN
jgi:excisionase family DNA binding protein